MSKVNATRQGKETGYGCMEAGDWVMGIGNMQKMMLRVLLQSCVFVMCCAMLCCALCCDVM